MHKAIWIALLSCTPVLSQILVRGEVYNNGAEPVQNALVEFINQTDSSLNYSCRTDTHGRYSVHLILTNIEPSLGHSPTNFNLYQNYPNPFNPSTIIAYDLPKPTELRIEIFNLLGQKIRTLVDGLQTDLHGRVVWDGSDDVGNGVSAGVYIYSLRANGSSVHKKMLLLDGQSASVSARPISLRKPLLEPACQAMTDPFLLRVSGREIATQEVANISIRQDTVLNVNVAKIVQDIDGNIYRTVKIGDQWWMAENLKTTHYRNGDPIYHITDGGGWSSPSGFYASRFDDPALISAYGLCYNWHAVVDSRDIAPEGWHVADVDEWRDMTAYLGTCAAAGGKLKETGTVYWNSPNSGATNQTGFSARGGDRRNGGGWYNELGHYAYFWTPEKWVPILFWDQNYLNFYTLTEQYGLSVRCVQDPAYPSAAFTVDPLFGPLTTDFQFNASASSDPQDPASLLQVRWDWENDGVWDTPFSSNKTATQTFARVGAKRIKLEVMDSNGQIRSTTRLIFVQNSNAENFAIQDIDGNSYRVVRIGELWWTAENLKVTHYANGDTIAYVATDTDWANLLAGAYCNYFNKESYVSDYGRLYNWYAQSDPRGLAPAGWRVPSDADWQALIDYLGGADVAGGKLKEAGFVHWEDPNTGATNESGFCARPAGRRDYRGHFGDLGFTTRFSCTTEQDITRTFQRTLNSHEARVGYPTQLYDTNRYGVPVRCCSY